jgi:PleD family two-component response regulator
MRTEPQQRAYDLSHIEVVVVDDCPIVVKLLGMMLNSMDIRKVYSTTDPVCALKVIFETRPHLVITDLLMDSIDGLSLAKSIRFCRDDELRCTPIFILTGFTDKEHVIQARDAGVNEVLAKPLSTRRIYQRICNLIERPQKFVETVSYFGPERRLMQENIANSDRRTRQAAAHGPEHRHIDVD